MALGSKAALDLSVKSAHRQIYTITTARVAYSLSVPATASLTEKEGMGSILLETETVLLSHVGKDGKNDRHIEWVNSKK